MRIDSQDGRHFVYRIDADDPTDAQIVDTVRTVLRFPWLTEADCLSTWKRWKTELHTELMNVASDGTMRSENDKRGLGGLIG